METKVLEVRNAGRKSVALRPDKCDCGVCLYSVSILVIGIVHTNTKY